MAEMVAPIQAESTLEVPIEAESASAPVSHSEQLEAENAAYKRHADELAAELAQIRAKYGDKDAPPPDPVKLLANEVNELKAGFSELLKTVKEQTVPQTPQAPTQQTNFAFPFGQGQIQQQPAQFLYPQSPWIMSPQLPSYVPTPIFNPPPQNAPVIVNNQPAK